MNQNNEPVCQELQPPLPFSPRHPNLIVPAMPHHPFYSIRPVSSSFPEPANPPQEHRWFILVRGAAVLFRPGDPSGTVIEKGPLPSGTVPERTQYLGRDGDTVYYGAEVPAGTPLPAGFAVSPVRELYGQVPDHDLALAAYAIRVLDFDRSTTFCGRCGAKTRPLRTERAKLCTDCNRITYPRISPAIIVLIRNGDEVLLARSPRFPGGIYSVLAGFVEPGESIEETVHREVMEEVGLQVADLRYFGSEPWPFPDSLMLGFVADYAGGEIRIDPAEIADAGWFSRDNLPSLPSRMSISRALIEAWIRREI